MRISSSPPEARGQHRGALAETSSGERQFARWVVPRAHFRTSASSGRAIRRHKAPRARWQQSINAGEIVIAPTVARDTSPPACGTPGAPRTAAPRSGRRPCGATPRTAAKAGLRESRASHARAVTTPAGGAEAHLADRRGGIPDARRVQTFRARDAPLETFYVAGLSSPFGTSSKPGVCPAYPAKPG